MRDRKTPWVMAIDARRLADLAVEAGGIADRPAGLLAQLAGHEFGRGARGEAARDEQQDLAHRTRPRRARPGATRVVLPAPGGAISKARVSLAQRRQQVRQHFVDGQSHHRSAVAAGFPR